jgi:hypothetical protein
VKHKVKQVVGAAKAAAEQRACDVAAFDAMCARRPMKAPPLRLLPPTVTAGQLELRKARKLGAAA